MKTTNACKTDEHAVSLGALKGGDVFRFAHISAADALKEDAFYLVLDAPEKDGVLIANTLDGKVMKRDRDHRVVSHEAEVHVAV